MDNYFNISPLIPVQFSDVIPDWYYFNHAESKCYYQKFNRSDSTTIQVLSTEEPSAQVLNFDNDGFVLSLSISEVNSLIDKDYKGYNIKFNASALSEGSYYIKVSTSFKTVYSEPISIAENHEGTLLLNYTNSENKFSVIFSEDSVFNFRVEGTIQDFTPSSEDVMYNDQYRNATLLDSVPYRLFNLYIGGAAGVPDWVIDKANRIMSCDQVKIDGHYFAKDDGASWEVNRMEEYPFSAMTLSITPTENNFTDSLVVDDDGAEVLKKVLLRKSANFDNVGANFQIDNIFKDKTLLDYITIYRKSGGQYTLKVGTTPNGKEVGEFLIREGIHTQTVRFAFNTESTLFLSGITGNNDFHVVYEQLNEEGGGQGGGGGVPEPVESSLNKFSGILFLGSYNDLINNFNLSTGLGRENTEWFGYAICDGRNGTVNLSDRFVLGWTGNQLDLYKTGGTKEESLTSNQQGSFDIRQLRDRSSGTNGVRQISGLQFRADSSMAWKEIPNPGTHLVWGSPMTVNISKSAEPHNNMPPYIYSIYVQKIQ